MRTIDNKEFFAAFLGDLLMSPVPLVVSDYLQPIYLNSYLNP